MNVLPDTKDGDDKKGTKTLRMGAGQRVGAKRDLDDGMEEDSDEFMDVDEGIGEMGYSGGASVSGIMGGGGGPSRGTKRNRPRG